MQNNANDCRPTLLDARDAAKLQLAPVSVRKLTEELISGGVGGPESYSSGVILSTIFRDMQHFGPTKRPMTKVMLIRDEHQGLSLELDVYFALLQKNQTAPESLATFSRNNCWNMEPCLARTLLELNNADFRYLGATKTNDSVVQCSRHDFIKLEKLPVSAQVLGIYAALYIRTRNGSRWAGSLPRDPRDDLPWSICK